MFPVWHGAEKTRFYVRSYSSYGKEVVGRERLSRAAVETLKKRKKVEIA